MLTLFSSHHTHTHTQNVSPDSLHQHWWMQRRCPKLITWEVLLAAQQSCHQCVSFRPPGGFPHKPLKATRGCPTRFWTTAGSSVLQWAVFHIDSTSLPRYSGEEEKENVSNGLSLKRSPHCNVNTRCYYLPCTASLSCAKSNYQKLSDFFSSQCLRITMWTPGAITSNAPGVCCVHNLNIKTHLTLSHHSACVHSLSNLAIRGECMAVTQCTLISLAGSIRSLWLFLNLFFRNYVHTVQDHQCIHNTGKKYALVTL